MYKKLCFLLLSLAIISCKSNKQTENWDVKNTRNIDVTDSIYLAKIKEARKNLPTFFASLEDRTINSYDFFVKAKISDSQKNTEHMWFAVHNRNNENLIVILDNVPLNLKNVKLGDTLEIHENQIEDWIVYKGDSIVAGNYLGKLIQ